MLFSDANDFYPTPADLAQKLAAPYLERVRSGEISSILDPSAGKGDLLKPFHGKDATLYVMEQSPELLSLLRGELTSERYNRHMGPRYHVLGADCFEYTGRHRFDLIVLNPPFSDSLKHFDHAFSLLAPGGELAAIMPSTDLKKDTKHRSLFFSTLEKYQAITTPCGSAFANSERKTGVDVTIVRIKKPAEVSFDFSGIKASSNAPISFDAEDLHNQLARNDKIGNLAQCFASATEALAEVHKAWVKAEFYLKPLGVCMNDIAPLDYKSRTSPENINGMIDAAQQKAWYRAVETSNVSHLFTGKMREDFGNFLASQGRMDFNAANIRGLFETLFHSRTSIAEQCVQDVFDKLCSYDAKNKIYLTNGWKTNSAHKVNHKVIIPGFVVYDGGFRLSYHRDYTALDDIDKALCHVVGKAFGQVLTIQQALTKRFDEMRPVWKGPRLVLPENVDLSYTAESEFFKCKFFKKGTLHLEFKDKKTWELFNVAAAKGRGWLAEAA